jgi:hypothetical protein
MILKRKCTCTDCGFLGFGNQEVTATPRYLLALEGQAGLPDITTLYCYRHLWVGYESLYVGHDDRAKVEEVNEPRRCEGFVRYVPGFNPKEHLDLEPEMSILESLSEEILKELLAEFRTQKRSATELEGGYEGMRLPTLKDELCGSSGASEVDFDLALNELQSKQLVGTGPLFVVDPPSSGGLLRLPGVRSKNEYAYLTENGYKAAQKVVGAKRQARTTNRVHISGGTFNHSPIGLGEHVTQSVTTSSAPVFADLRNAILGSTVEKGHQAELLARVDAMENARKSGGFMQQYQEFIACAANHMTVIAPFIPALTALLH